MKEFEIVSTYLNGCAGEAYPITAFEEAELKDPADYLKAKFGKDFQYFVKEVRPSGQIVYTFDNGTVKHIYEFTQL